MDAILEPLAGFTHYPAQYFRHVRNREAVAGQAQGIDNHAQNALAILAQDLQ